MVNLNERISNLEQENMSLLMLIQRIRVAAGDPNGRLMQDELIEHIKKLNNCCVQKQTTEDQSEALEHGIIL